MKITVIKTLFIIIIVIFIVMGCSKDKTKKTLETNTWSQIVNKEWTNSDFWAGTGLYFYEENSKPYCVFMIYGSGLPVIFNYTSEVIIEEEGIIQIVMPNNMNPELIISNNDKQYTKINLKFDNNKILAHDKEYKVIFNRSILEMIDELK